VGSSGAEKSETYHAVSREKEVRQGCRQTCRPTVPQPRGQHARCEEKIEQEEIKQEKVEPEKVVSPVARKTLKDPRGGLTTAGREWFAKKQGSHLKPGVKKSRAEMTPADMRRKGSWAVRFYGRKGKLPPLSKPNGEPTRYALSAAAWGEPVPKTVTAARRIAAKGHQLLAAYEKAIKKSSAKKSTAKKTKSKTARRG
jgi:hypothetical protein